MEVPLIGGQIDDVVPGEEVGGPVRLQEHRDEHKPPLVHETECVLILVVNPRRLVLPGGHEIRGELGEQQEIVGAVLQRRDELRDLEVRIGVVVEVLHVEECPVPEIPQVSGESEHELLDGLAFPLVGDEHSWRIAAPQGTSHLPDRRQAEHRQPHRQRSPLPCDALDGVLVGPVKLCHQLLNGVHVSADRPYALVICEDSG